MGGGGSGSGSGSSDGSDPEDDLDAAYEGGGGGGGGSGSDGDLEAYASAFMRTGFTGGINWYRNMHRNWEAMRPWRHAPLTIPAMFIGGTKDPVLTSSGPATSEHPLLQLQAQYAPDMRVRWIDDAGHWTQQEKPAETTAALVEFLAEVT